MVLAYGAANATQILYQEQFPDRVVPNSKKVQRLTDAGKFHPRTEDRGRDRCHWVLDLAF
jgi:hypothetical protein